MTSELLLSAGELWRRPGGRVISGGVNTHSHAGLFSV